MGAVDHVVGRSDAAGVVHLGDRIAERLARRQAAVGLHREGDHGGQAHGGGRPGDADRLLGVGHRDGGDHLGTGLGEGAGLQPVVGGRLGGRHRRPDHIAVAARADHAVDDRRETRPLDGERRHELDSPVVDGGQTDGVVAEAGPPVEVGPPRGRVQHEPGAEALGEIEVRRVVGDQAGPSVLGVEQGKGREVGQVETLVEHEGGLETAVGQERAVGSELGQGHWWSPLVGFESVTPGGVSLGLTS